jgi:hypothetical protein
VRGRLDLVRLELGSKVRLALKIFLGGVGCMSFYRLRMGKSKSRWGRSRVIRSKMMMRSDIDFGIVMKMLRMISTLTLPILIVRMHLTRRRHLHIFDSG